MNSEDQAAPKAVNASGEAIVQAAMPHVGDKYVLGVLVPKDNSTWRGPWDCAEFASWSLFQPAGILYGCDRDHGDPSTADAYTGYWARDAASLGRIVTIEEAARTPGAFVLRAPKPGATGHIVISLGDGRTVEAHSTKMGVIESTLSNRRWDMGILVPGVTYTAGSAVAVQGPGVTLYRLTTPPMTGDKVLDIQRALKSAGFDPGTVDGEFGPHTHAAVVAFQLSHGLLPDGEVGPSTAAELGIQL